MALPVRVNQAGFTLLELLIVVVVLGILVSIIATNLTDSNNRATVAAGKQFDGNLQRVRGDYLIGNWLLDDCTGTSARDSSGNNVTGTLNGSITWDTTTVYSKGCSLLFPGGAAYTRIESTANSNYSVQTGTIRTFSAWFKKSGTLSGQQQILYKNGGCIGWSIRMNVSGSITGEYTTPACGGSQTYTVVSPGRYNDGVWHMVVLTVDRVVGTMTLYIDGNQVSTGAVNASESGSGGSFNVGNNWNFTEGFSGNIDEVRAYSTDLELSMLKKLYAIGTIKRWLLIDLPD